jgi:4a-hydroxytetrahydrobiopterin dehydratase
MKLSDKEVAELLVGHEDWERKGDAIVKTFTFPKFGDAIAYVTRLAFDAESMDHHPDLQISYRKVTVTWSTHSAGGLTAKDFTGAAQSDMIAAKFAK